MHIRIIEDDRCAGFYPLTFLRPVFDLRCGVRTLREKILRHLAPASWSLQVRPLLLPLVAEENPDASVNVPPPEGVETICINGRVVMTQEAARKIRKEKGDVVFLAEKGVAAVRFTGGMPPEAAEALFRSDALPSFRTVQTNLLLADYPWDLLYANGEEIVRDSQWKTVRSAKRTPAPKIHRTAVLTGRTNIQIGSGSTIGPGVVVDASSGPVVIGRDVAVQAHSVIQGPVSIGDGSVVKPGTRINPNTSIGPVCKVAGEIEFSILQSYSNKAHEGYLGHSFLGSWVNLGAGTTTSNLKNTYGPVKVLLNGQSLDTGRMFLGLTAGDHVKTGINATLDTGTIVGICSNLFGTDLPPKYVPSFSWGDAGSLVPYDLSRALIVAERMMARRSVPCTAAYTDLIKETYRLTLHERAGDTTTV